MRIARLLRPFLASLLATPLLFPAAAEAHHFGRIYHCPSGQFWRPSLGLCQNHPYDGAADAPYRPRHRVWASAPAPVAGRPRVDTHTEVVSRSRSLERGGLVVRYVVQTSVVERYARARSPSPHLTRLSAGGFE